MNRQNLRRYVRWAEKIAAAQRQLADELADEARKAEASPDPLGLYIFTARSRYRVTSDGDKSKSGKRTQLELESSYREATKLGFDGAFKMWLYLMRIGRLTSPLPATKKRVMPIAQCSMEPPWLTTRACGLCSAANIRSLIRQTRTVQRGMFLR
ncbi:MAG: hypothetical protein ABJF10_17465 [Chthoniobacter sp.]